jgi:hypothetical protein
VIAVDPGTAAARELCSSKRGDYHELESPHTGRTDHRPPPAAAKTIAARRPIAAAQSERSSHVSQCGSKEPALDLDRGDADCELGSRTAVEDWPDIEPSQGKASVRARARTASELKKAGGASIR